jgi:hypothetical protein
VGVVSRLRRIALLDYFRLYYWIYEGDFPLSGPSQIRALKNYRKRLAQRGLARFEVLGLDSDRDLIRSLAQRLAVNGAAESEIRSSIRRRIAEETPPKGGILKALRRSPMVGTDLDLSRPQIDARPVDL